MSTPSPESVPEDVRNAAIGAWRRHQGNRIASNSMVAMLADAVRAGQAMGTQDHEPTTLRSDARHNRVEV